MKTTLALTLLAVGSAAAQGVMPPPAITDTATGLQWLSLTATLGWPYSATIQAPWWEPFPGYTNATADQVVQLFNDLGLPSTAPILDANAAHPFFKAMTALGTTYTNDIYPGMLGMVQGGQIFGIEPVIVNDVPQFWRLDGTLWQDPNQRWLGESIWMVSQIPEPSSGRLVIGGLVLWGMIGLSVLGGRKGKQ